MICVPIAEATFSEVRHCLEECMGRAGMAEIRLDSLNEECTSAACGELISKSSIPLIFTCRKADEGGAFKGTEQERIQCLKNAVDAGAEFIDIELETEKGLRDEVVAHAHNRWCRVIMSWHNFNETPALPMLEKVLDRQVEAGADIAKIVTMGRESGDIPRLFSLYYRAEKAGIPLVAFCMGDAGRISRVACLAMGAFLSFASQDTGAKTAPGQIPLSRFRMVMDLIEKSES